MTLANRPDRDLVAAASREEAEAVGLSFDEFVHSRSISATQARRRMFRRILSLTGCSPHGLAHIFGCYPQDVMEALREPAPQKRKPPPAGFRDVAEPFPLTGSLASLAEIERIQHGNFAQ